MNSPKARYRFYREHKYVTHRLFELERKIAKADLPTAASIQEIQNDLQELESLLKHHAHYEETAFHSLLSEKKSLIYLPVEEDHREQGHQFQRLKDELAGISNSEGNHPASKAYSFYLSYRLFVAENLRHFHLEESTLLPELQRLYSDQELQKVEAVTYAKMTPEELRNMLEVLFPHFNTDDQIAFIRDIQEAEPEKLELAWPGFRKHFPL